MLDIHEIQRLLPHRYPFLLIDRIIEMEPGKRIVGLKNVTINEPYFVGHFPGLPIMPGVLILESMAQAGGVLVKKSMNVPDEKLMFFMGIDKAKFRRPVVPGDQLRIEVESLKMLSKMGIFKARGSVAGQKVAEAEIAFGTQDASSS